MPEPKARRWLAALAVAALAAVGGCTGGSNSTSSGGHPTTPAGPGSTGTSTPAAVHWQACGPGSRLRCGRIHVPLNYADPGGRKITLALNEVPATAPARQRLGILLVNPGGPGASGTVLASFVAQGLAPAVAARCDIIGFDPRGVGASVPALTCQPSFFSRARPNYIPANASAEQVLIGRA